jgi:hypothetical protein
VRLLRRVALTVAVALVLPLAACSGLPTSGSVQQGLPPGDVDSNLDLLFLRQGPVKDATPEQIITGFIEAGASPAGGWAVARQFFYSPELANSWHPESGVSIDRSWASRQITNDESVVASGFARLEVTLTPVASVDSAGSYRESPGGTARAPFDMRQNSDGQWRIVSAPDGIILDANAFELVFQRHLLQYFDPDWEHLVPDPRWFPRRTAISTSIAKAVISGFPSSWLAESVRSAFPGGVSLAAPTVPVSGEDMVAEVALSASAASLDSTTLARMRTQLERSLVGTGVSRVRFTVDGRELPAGTVEVVTNRIDSSTFVLTQDAFGPSVGGEIVSLPGISDVLVQHANSIVSIDLSGDSDSAAVMLKSANVARISDGVLNQLDDRPGLIAPVHDSDGFIWSVPATAPQELWAWAKSGEVATIADAWPEASGISQLRVAPDGARVAATVSIGGQEWVGLAGILRDELGVPIALGEFERLGRLPGPGLGLAWLGEDALGVLTREGETLQLVERVIGGPAATSIVPTDTIAIAGANAISGVRLLWADGVVAVKRGTSWQASVEDVLVLATQSGK